MLSFCRANPGGPGDDALGTARHRLSKVIPHLPALSQHKRGCCPRAAAWHRAAHTSAGVRTWGSRPWPGPFLPVERGEPTVPSHPAATGWQHPSTVALLSPPGSEGADSFPKASKARSKIDFASSTFSTAESRCGLLCEPAKVPEGEILYPGESCKLEKPPVYVCIKFGDCWRLQPAVVPCLC